MSFICFNWKNTSDVFKKKRKILASLMFWLTKVFKQRALASGIKACCSFWTILFRLSLESSFGSFIVPKRAIVSQIDFLFWKIRNWPAELSLNYFESMPNRYFNLKLPFFTHLNTLLFVKLEYYLLSFAL